VLHGNIRLTEARRNPAFGPCSTQGQQWQSRQSGGHVDELWKWKEGTTAIWFFYPKFPIRVLSSRNTCPGSVSKIKTANCRVCFAFTHCPSDNKSHGVLVTLSLGVIFPLSIGCQARQGLSQRRDDFSPCSRRQIGPFLPPNSRAPGISTWTRMRCNAAALGSCKNPGNK
jgi:hypothetical protein